MPKREQPTLTLDDEDDGRLHVVWSRSGKTLGVSVSTKMGADYKQIGLRHDQVEALIRFLSESLVEVVEDR